MRVTVLPDREARDREAAALVWEAAAEKPDLLICLASGETPSGTYVRLAGAPERLAQARFIQLDEWAGLDADDAASCAAYLERAVKGPLAVPDARWIGFRGAAPDAAAECRRVAAALKAAGPIDLCILGLGRNGHLALNEPAESLDPSPATSPPSMRAPAPIPCWRKPTGRSARGSPSASATSCARRILLLVSGSAKREPLARLAAGRVSTQLPASFLWLHGDVLCLCDRAAASDTGIEGAGR